MTEPTEFEFRNKTFLMEELFHIHQDPDPKLMLEDCFIILHDKARYYNSSNNNMIPTRFEYLLQPNYDLWGDKPDSISIMTLKQTMEQFALLITSSIANYKASSPMAPSVSDQKVLEKVEMAVSVSIIDTNKIDPVHMATMYQRYGKK